MSDTFFANSKFLSFVLPLAGHHHHTHHHHHLADAEMREQQPCGKFYRFSPLRIPHMRPQNRGRKSLLSSHSRRFMLISAGVAAEQQSGQYIYVGVVNCLSSDIYIDLFIDYPRPILFSYSACLPLCAMYVQSEGDTRIEGHQHRQMQK